MKKLLTLGATMLLLAAACGGGSAEESLLQLRGQNVTEEALRTDLRGVLAQGGAEAFCASLTGLSPQEVVDTIQAAQGDDAAEATSDVTGTPVPGQEPDPEDNRRYAEILLEECDRITG